MRPEHKRASEPLSSAATAAWAAPPDNTKGWPAPRRRTTNTNSGVQGRRQTTAATQPIPTPVFRAVGKQLLPQIKAVADLSQPHNWLDVQYPVRPLHRMQQ